MPLSLPRSGAIAFAECASSVTSLGAVWLMGSLGQDKLIEPLRDYIARHLIKPCYHCTNIHTPYKTDKDAELMQEAKIKASTLLKGIIMIGVGFATHIPTQMFLEGKLHFGEIEEFKQVVTGKTLGLVTTLVSMGVTEKMSPGIIEKIENRVIKSLGLKPEEASEPVKDHAIGSQDFRKLTFIEIPSSVVSGLVNYCFTKQK